MDMSFRRVQHDRQTPVLGLVQNNIFESPPSFQTCLTEQEVEALRFDASLPVRYKTGDVVLYSSSTSSGLGIVQNDDDSAAKYGELCFAWVPYGGDTHVVPITDPKLRKVTNKSAQHVANCFGDWFWEGEYKRYHVIKTRIPSAEKERLKFDQYKRGDVIFWSTRKNCASENEPPWEGLGLVSSVQDNRVFFDWVPYGGDRMSTSNTDPLLRRVTNVSAHDVTNHFEY